MESDSVPNRRYALVVSGELGDRFAAAFDGMRFERSDGKTIIVGEIVDQAHLLGLVERIGDLGLELISISPENLDADLAAREGSASTSVRNPG